MYMYLAAKAKSLHKQLFVQLAIGIYVTLSGTCSEAVAEEDRSHSEDLDDNELIRDGMELIEEEYEDVEGDE